MIINSFMSRLAANMPLPVPETKRDRVILSDDDTSRTEMDGQRRPHRVRVLHEGFSRLEENTGDMFANCTSTLIIGHKFNIIVDTMTAWDGDKILQALAPSRPDSINYVICTHGHSDHIGCNYLFKYAIHVVGFSMSTKERYINVNFDKGEEFLIEPGIRVIPTPGHTASDVSVIVDTGDKELGVVAITGDLFEREEDLTDPSLWRDLGGSENPDLQQENRNKILAIADYIVPGHGPMFKNPTKKSVSEVEASGPSTSSSGNPPDVTVNEGSTVS